MRILITRPLGDAEETASRLAALGHEVVFSPMLEIRTRVGPEIALANVQAILATSANGVRALAARSSRRDILLLAVGQKSAETSLKLRFENVRHANGDAVALANLAINTLSPDGGALLHAAGNETRGDLAGRLEKAGFRVRTEVLYDAIAATDFTETAREALQNNWLQGALFFSPRTAEIFASLVRESKLEAACKTLHAFCISRETANALHALQFLGFHVAEYPNEEALLSLLN